LVSPLKPAEPVPEVSIPASVPVAAGLSAEPVVGVGASGRPAGGGAPGARGAGGVDEADEVVVEPRVAAPRAAALVDATRRGRLVITGKAGIALPDASLGAMVGRGAAVGGAAGSAGCAVAIHGTIASIASIHRTPAARLAPLAVLKVGEGVLIIRKGGITSWAWPVGLQWPGPWALRRRGRRRAWMQRCLAWTFRVWILRVWPALRVSSLRLSGKSR